jgi:hypothetical protein
MSVNTASTEPKAKAFYSTSDLMARWDVSRTTIWREVKRGVLRQTKVAGCVRFASSEVLRYENCR